MPALWSPEDLATRFARYLEELHDVFAMHGLHYGSPDDIRLLAARLERPGQLNEELASLVRSMVLREGGSIPRTDLLEIVAIAIAGPRMDPAGEELQHSVRQLLTFLHAALRRPWNEPPGEERLHSSDEDVRAEAARELREAAAKIEAEAQTSALHQAQIGQGDSQEAHALRANVIPFGRARAVFSRLARMEAAELSDVPGEPDSEIHSAAETARSESSLEPPPTADIAGESTAAQGVTVEIPYTPPAQRVVTEQLAVPLTSRGEATGPTEMSPAPEISSALKLSSIATRDAADASPATDQPSRPSPAESVPAPPIRQSVPFVATLPEFDEEPPLPAAPRLTRTALLSGVAAAALIAVVLGSAVLARTGEHRATAKSSEPAAELAPAGPAPTTDAQAQTSSPVTATSATPKRDPDVSASSRSGAGSHFDDGYVAAPYSSMPMQTPSPPVADRVEAQDGSLSSPSPVAHAPLQQMSDRSIETSRPRDADASIVGDLPVRTTTVALEEPPLHPSISAAVMAQNLVSGPRPEYPMLAKIAHADGPVILHAEITRGGTVTDTQVVSGHFLLRRAAEAAVRHWRYQPYRVDGKPVPVSTTIMVRFQDNH